MWSIAAAGIPLPPFLFGAAQEWNLALRCVRMEHSHQNSTVSHGAWADAGPQAWWAQQLLRQTVQQLPRM